MEIRARLQGFPAAKQGPTVKAYGYRQISRTRGQGVGKPRPTSHLGLSMTLFQWDKQIDQQKR